MPPKVTRRRAFLRPIPIILTLASLAFVIWYTFAPSGMYECYGLRKQKRMQAERIRELEAQKKQLSDYLAALKSGDQAALERAAREKGFVAPNETIYNLKVEDKKH